MNGYDVLMVLWGALFVIAAAGFILTMNGIFGFEERRQDLVAHDWERNEGSTLPLRPAA